MALPKKQTARITTKINSFTGEPLNENVNENDIVEFKEFSRFKIFNNSGEELECFRVRGKDNDDYLVSLAFQNTLPYCNAIQYKRLSYSSLFFGEVLIDPNYGILDEGFTWVPVVKEFV